jgi:transposase
MATSGCSQRAPERVWAIEDCRHVSGGLERFLLFAGEQVVRVPPKLMAGARESAREFGKSDSIDALAVAQAALRYRGRLPVARLAGVERDIALLLDHREGMIAERTRTQNRLRWLLHDLARSSRLPLANSTCRESSSASMLVSLDGNRAHKSGSAETWFVAAESEPSERPRSSKSSASSSAVTLARS